MRRIFLFVTILILVFCLAIGTAFAEEPFKPSTASAPQTMFATGITVVVAAFFLIVCVFLVMREGSSATGDKKYWPMLLLACVVAIFLRVVVSMAYEGYQTDIACFKGWALAAYEQTPSNFYTCGMFADYPPGYMYILYFLGFVRQLFDISANSAMFTLIIKLPSIIAEVVTALLIYKIGSRQIGKRFGLLCSAFVLFNPAMFFNSSAWGQIDAVFVLFIVLTIYFLNKENFLAGAALFAIALLIKPQAIMFAPVVGLAYIYALFKKGELKKALIGIFGGAAIAGAIIFAAVLPFTGSQQPLWIIDKYAGTVGSYPYATLNAFNLFALAGANFVYSTEPFLWLDYQTWGTIFIVLICVIVVILQWRNRTRRRLFDISAFLIVSVYMLAHAMHERYILPACICLIFAYVYSRDSMTLVFAAAFSVFALFNQMVTLYADGVVTAALPTLVFSALNVGLYAVYAFLTMKKLTSSKVLIKSPALHG